MIPECVGPSFLTISDLLMLHVFFQLCARDATCFNSPGSFSCSCNTGYGPAGDGGDGTRCLATQQESIAALAEVTEYYNDGGDALAKLALGSLDISQPPALVAGPAPAKAKHQRSIGAVLRNEAVS